MKNEDQPEREPTPEELAKAERVTWILYVVMAVFVVAPFVTAWLIKS